MARIVRALPGYGDIQAGFPVIVDERMAIIEPAFAYLHELATVPGRSHAVETIRTYGEHLHDWFDSLEQSQIAWDGVGEREIAGWRNRMLECPSPHTKRPYARSTINDRVRTVCRFYGWAHQRGWIEDLPFHFIDVRVRHQRPSMLAHLDVRPGVVAANVLTVPEAERLPRALRADQLRRLFSALAPPYDLMASWALVTGMRRKELCALELFQVPETAHLDAGEHPLIGIGLSITKGGQGEAQDRARLPCRRERTRQGRGLGAKMDGVSASRIHRARRGGDRQPGGDRRRTASFARTRAAASRGLIQSGGHSAARFHHNFGGHHDR